MQEDSQIYKKKKKNKVSKRLDLDHVNSRGHVRDHPFASRLAQLTR